MTAVRGAFRWAIRYRYPLLLIAVVARAVIEGRGTFGLDDPHLFAVAGAKLAGSGWSSVFADKAIQAGPLQLALMGVLAAAGEATGLGFKMISSLVIQTAYLAALLMTLRAVAKDRGVEDPAPLELAAGLFALIWGMTWVAFDFGHPAQAFIPLLWIVAARNAQMSRPLMAGVLLAAATGLETWGALGAPVLLLAPQVVDAIKGAAAQALVTAAMFGPFFIFGAVHMLEYKWLVDAHSPVAAIAAPGSVFGWPLRLLQAFVVLGVGAGVAIRTRGYRSSPWLVLLAVVLTRLLLDPLAFSVYYWLPVETIALIGAGTVVAAADATTLRVGAAAALYLVFLPPLIPAAVVMGLVLLLVVAVVLLRRLSLVPLPATS